MELSERDALIIVDVQNDFCPGGALPVATGMDVASTMSMVANTFQARGARVYATQDWHPPGHSSFAEQGGPWPPHCVQDTDGADFHPAMVFPAGVRIVRKGTSPGQDAYSGFIDSDLEAQLKDAGVTRVFVGGLATDYCVLNTVLDATRNGFETYVLSDAIGAVDVEPGDGDRAVGRMADAGARFATSTELLAPA